MKTTRTKFLNQIDYRALCLKNFSKKNAELGMVLSRPLPEEDFRIGAEIDDVGNPPKSAIEIVMDMMKGKPYIPTFLQERVAEESVPKVIRASDITRGFGIEYGVSPNTHGGVHEYLNVRFDQSYLGKTRFDVNFYKNSEANSLFLISVDCNGKVQLEYMLQPSPIDSKITERSKSLREYLRWNIGLRQQIEGGASAEQVVDYIFDFLKKRGLGTDPAKIQNH